MTEPSDIPTGPVWSAILAASIASASLGILTLLTELSPAISKLLAFVKSAGDLSGVTTLTLLIWIAAWILVHRRWKSKTITATGRTASLSLLLVLLGLVGTFPPVGDWLTGR